ncbi:hypothetical protein [Isoptericola sp. NPDC056605]|uniref:hypothetical protein n=1 Tax=Isoptericola sp. NPDC056605 TaxID=3345876 RepID=UPI00369F1E32
MDTPAARRQVDARSVAITGLTTLAWYAVPDVVRPRWARALAKVGVLAGGLGLGMALTSEGRSAVDGMREVRDELRDLRDADENAAGENASEPDEGIAPADGRDAREPDDNVLAADVALDGADPLPGPGVAGAAVAGALALAVTIAVAGEKWAYRRGERWRAQGRRLPHTRVGLILGALAAVATALDPSISMVPPVEDEAPAS